MGRLSTTECTYLPTSVHRQRPRAVQPVLRAGKYKQKGGLRWTQEEWTPT